MAALTAYSIGHFLIDLSCAAVILGRVVPNRDPATTILLYNLLAFAAQMPIGLLADRFGHTKYFAAAGCALVFAAMLSPIGLVTVALAGLGNAFYHVGGGVYALGFEDKIGPLGIFVSPGAIGLYIGTVYRFDAPTPVLCAALAVTAVCVLLCETSVHSASEPPTFGQQIDNGGLRKALAVLCLFIVVAVRSFAGLAGTFEWKSEYGFIAVCAVAFGKAFGGIAADRFGAMQAAALSLGISALCFLAGEIMPFGLAALFAFNMTMPLTLAACARLLPKLKGFSFGLLTFALFLGFLPVFCGVTGIGSTALAICAAASLPILMFGSKSAFGSKETPQEGGLAENVR